MQTVNTPLLPEDLQRLQIALCRLYRRAGELGASALSQEATQRSIEEPPGSWRGDQAAEDGEISDENSGQFSMAS